jgi:hypothetical protein
MAFGLLLYFKKNSFRMINKTKWRQVHLIGHKDNMKLISKMLVPIFYVPAMRYRKWPMSWQNQHNGFATSMDPEQPAHPSSLIRIHAVRLQTLLQVEKLIANSMDPDQTARKRRLVWIHACRKRITLVLSSRVSNEFCQFAINKWYSDRKLRTLVIAITQTHWII